MHSEHTQANFARLQEAILSRSSSPNWMAAKNEWRLVDIELDRAGQQCPCGQPIKELCYIENVQNGDRIFVGNVCIRQFLGIDTGNTFQGLRRIVEDDTANANEDLIRHAQKFGYIFEREVDFLLQTRRKRSLSPKQIEWKQKINRRILSKTVVNKA